jgi:hypothetical protein
VESAAGGVSAAIAWDGRYLADDMQFAEVGIPVSV